MTILAVPLGIVRVHLATTLGEVVHVAVLQFGKKIPKHEVELVPSRSLRTLAIHDVQRVPVDPLEPEIRIDLVYPLPCSLEVLHVSISVRWSDQQIRAGNGRYGNGKCEKVASHATTRRPW